MPEENTAPPRLRTRLSGQDASFLYGESTNGPLHIGSIAIFEGIMPFDKMVASIEERLHLIPRYRQRLLRTPLNLSHPTLEDDPGFKIRNHVFRHQLNPSLTEAQAFERMMRAYEPPVRFDRPLWEIHSFEGLKGNRTALVSKVHHCLVDGVSGVELIKATYDFKREPDPVVPPEQPWKPRSLTPAASRLFGGAQENIRGRINALRNLASGLIAHPQSMVEGAGALGKALEVIAGLVSRPIVATPWN